MRQDNKSVSKVTKCQTNRIHFPTEAEFFPSPLPPDRLQPVMSFIMKSQCGDLIFICYQYLCIGFKQGMARVLITHSQHFPSNELY